MRWILMSVALLLPLSNAWAEDVTCPPSIEIAPQSLTKELSGWRIFFDKVNNSYALETVSMYSGEPEQLGSLVPDKNTKSYSEWILYDNGKHDYYLTCGYSHTSLQLTRKLSPALKKCRVSYEKDLHNGDGSGVPSKIICE